MVVDLDGQQYRAICYSGGQRMSFRSVKEAVEAAKDGDQVILLPGIHNGMGYDISATAAA